ncbi:MAG: CvpA family protein [Verrucomicrobiia bacterium]
MIVAQTLIKFDTHWYDALVMIALIIGLWNGMRMGFSAEVLRAVGLVVGVIAGVLYYAVAGQWLTEHLELVSERANLLMFVAIVLGVHIVFGFVRLAVRRWTQNRPLSGFVENIGGALAGLVRMLAIMVGVTVYLCLLQSEFWHEQVGRESRFGQRVVQEFPDLAPAVEKREMKKAWFQSELKRRPEADIEQTEPEKH